MFSQQRLILAYTFTQSDQSFLCLDQALVQKRMALAVEEMCRLFSVHKVLISEDPLCHGFPVAQRIFFCLFQAIPFLCSCITTASPVSVVCDTISLCSHLARTSAQHITLVKSVVQSNKGIFSDSPAPDFL